MESCPSCSHLVSGEAASSSASASVAGTLGTATVLMVQAGRVQASGSSSSDVADSNAPAGWVACQQRMLQTKWSTTYEGYSSRADGRYMRGRLKLRTK